MFSGYERVVGPLGISIGTEIMLESLFPLEGERYDPDRKIPNILKLNDYKIHYYDIYTLARNLLGSYKNRSDQEAIMNNNILIDELMHEVNVINSLYDGYKCEPVLFVPIYDKVYKGLNLDKSVVITDKTLQLINYITFHLKKERYDINMDVLSNTYKLKSTTNKVLITTHLPVDLLNIRILKNLLLLESYTGKLKNSKEWYNKYHKIGKLNLDIFPFVEEIYYILGDDYMVRPMKLALRRDLHQLAATKNWTQYTDWVKVKSDLLKSSIFNKLIKNYKRLY